MNEVNQLRARLDLLTKIVAFQTIVIASILIIAAKTRTNTGAFDTITAQRIDIREPDGTIRMIVSNHAKFPGLIVRGKEKPYDRPYAGMLFYNNEGSENGGLVFGGHKNEKGEVVDSGGSLSFDKYDASQVVQLAGVDDREDKFAGLVVRDSSPKESRRRIWVGRDDRGNASLALMDAQGKKRIEMNVGADGTPSIVLLDADGKVIRQLAP